MLKNLKKFKNNLHREMLKKGKNVKMWKNAEVFFCLKKKRTEKSKKK